MTEAVKQDAEMVIMKMEVLKDWLGDSLTQKSFKEAIDIAIQSIQEVEQYRAIGSTPTQILERIGGLDVELGKYHCLGTVEELKEAKEKQVAKKPRFYAHNYYCTECGNLVGNNEFKWQRFLYCDSCGQKLDWEEGGTSD